MPGQRRLPFTLHCLQLRRRAEELKPDAVRAMRPSTLCTFSTKQLHRHAVNWPVSLSVRVTRGDKPIWLDADLSNRTHLVRRARKNNRPNQHAAYTEVFSCRLLSTIPISADLEGFVDRDVKAPESGRERYPFGLADPRSESAFDETPAVRWEKRFRRLSTLY